MGALDLAGRGVRLGHHEAPRGALGHWVHIKNGTIDNYQAVVPTHLERVAARCQRPARRRMKPR